ncbi:Methylosome subunit pICln [Coemansia sp. RSA 1365]|nr:Methylosome subunit pICln [Coemansia sp. RSA 1365]
MIVLHRELSVLSGIKFTADSTRVECDPSSNSLGGTGTLYICEPQLVFFCKKEKRGFSLNYQNIVIHAVSKEPEKAAHLYCQLDCQLPGIVNGCNSTNGNTHGSEDEDSEQDDETEDFAEIRFYPEDPQILDELFKAMCECAALNPDVEEDSESNTANNEDYKSDNDHGDEENEEEYSNSIQTIGDFNPSDFITSPDQLDQLSQKGKRVLERLESVIVLPDNKLDGVRSADADEEPEHMEK